MADVKDAFICYRSYIEAIRLLPEDKRWWFLDSVIQYALDGVEPDFSGTESAMFTLMRANLDSCNKRYAVSVENGKKGGRPPIKDGEKKPKGKSSKASPKSAEPGDGEPFLLDGKLHQYYIAENGERRVRKLE